jgi:hypothetical protein
LVRFGSSGLGRGFTVLAALGSLAGCGAVYDPARFRSALDQRDAEGARDLLDGVLVRARSGETKQSGRDTGRLLLERASLRMSLEDFAGAVRDFDQADRLLDRQAMRRSRYLTGGFNPQGTVYMYERGWSQALNLPYGAKFYERLLLNPLAALGRLELDDGGGACIEARRFGVMSEWTEQVAAGRAEPVRAFGELVSVLACTDVDASLACSALARAKALAPALASGAGISCEGVAPGKARLGIMIGYGRPSHPLSLPDTPQEVSLAGGAEASSERVSLAVDGTAVAAVEMLDVDAAVRDDYADGQHALVVHLFGQSGYAGGWSNVAWESLPAHIHFATLDTTEGPHEVSVQVRGQTRTRTVLLGAQRERVIWFGAPW